MLGLVSNANGGTLQISYFQEGTFCNGHTKISARSNCAGRQSILDLLVDCPLVQTHLNIFKLGRVKTTKTCQRRDLPNFHCFPSFKKRLLQSATSHEGLSYKQICQNARHLQFCWLPLGANEISTHPKKSSFQFDGSSPRPVKGHLNTFRLGRVKRIMTCPWRDLPSVSYLTPLKKTICVIGHFTRRSQQHANLPECKTSRTLLTALGCIQNTNTLKEVLSSNRLYLDIAMPGNL